MTYLLSLNPDLEVAKCWHWGHELREVCVSVCACVYMCVCLGIHPYAKRERDSGGVGNGLCFGMAVSLLLISWLRHWDPGNKKKKNITENKKHVTRQVNPSEQLSVWQSAHPFPSRISFFHSFVLSLCHLHYNFFWCD